MGAKTYIMSQPTAISIQRSAFSRQSPITSYQLPITNHPAFKLLEPEPGINFPAGF
jgi:hypothetical protein